MSQLSSSAKDDNSSVLVEHSTPYSSRSHVTVRPRRLPVISPLVISESPFKATVDQFDSPDLFSDTSQEHCDSSASKSGNMFSTTKEDEARCNVATKNGYMHNSTNRNEDRYTTANEKRVSSNTANNAGERFDIDWTSNELSEKDSSSKGQISNSSARTDLELEIKLQKLSSNDIQNISDKIKSLSLNDDSTGDISNRNESKMIECTHMRDVSANKSSNGHDMYSNVDSLSHENRSGRYRVVCGENNGHSDLTGCTSTQNVSNGMEHAPFKSKCEDFDDSLQDRRNLSTQKQRQSLEKVSDITGESVDHLNKNQVENISNAVQHASNGNIPHETNDISKKYRSKVLQDECQQEDAMNTHQEFYIHNTKPVHSANMKAASKKLAGLRLLDAKVYLNKKKGLISSSSNTVKNHTNMSALQNSLGSVNINVDVHPRTHSGDDLRDLPPSEIHPLLSSDVQPPRINSGNELPVSSPGEVHPPIPSSGEIPQHISGKNGFAEEITPKNCNIHTPLTGQQTGKVIRNPNYSSFVVRA